MRLIVMYVRVAGPMGCTWHLISLSWPIGYVYVWHWKGCCHLCLTVILALKASMDDVASWLHLCLMLELVRVYAWCCLAGCCIYVWCHSLCTCALGSPCWLVIIVAIAWCNVENDGIVTILVVVVAIVQCRIWNSSCAIRLVVNIWCCCSRFLVVLVAVMQHDIDMACACAQGLVVVPVVRRDV